MAVEQMVIDTAEKIFADHCDKLLLDNAEQGNFPRALWQLLQDNGFHLLAMADSGVDLADTFAVIKLAGRHGLPLPLPEILLANRWTGKEQPFVTIGSLRQRTVVDAPWGREADAAIGLDSTGRWRYGVAIDVSVSHNMAGEPRDCVTIKDDGPLPYVDPHAYEWLALARAVQMSGCLERILELSLTYAGEREQFGRSISKFQAIQHLLAVMAAEVAAAGRAADAAVDALGDERFPLDVAAAKVRVGEAAGVVAEQAHQVHGAMGYTHEHQLHHFTRRLWAWRDEYGNEAYWQRRLGERLVEIGADHIWDFLATRG